MNITRAEGIVLNAMLQIVSTLPLNTSVRFVFTNGPDNAARTWLLNSGERWANILTDDHRIADLTVTVSHEDMHALLEGELDSGLAYTQGKVLLDGDWDVAIELKRWLDLCIDSYAVKEINTCCMAFTAI